MLNLYMLYVSLVYYNAYICVSKLNVEVLVLDEIYGTKINQCIKMSYTLILIELPRITSTFTKCF